MPLVSRNVITGKLHQEGKNGGEESSTYVKALSYIKDVFPKEIYIITKKIEEKNKQARRGSNIESYSLQIIIFILLCARGLFDSNVY